MMNADPRVTRAKVAIEVIETTFLPTISEDSELRLGPSERPAAKSAIGRTSTTDSLSVRLSVVLIAGGTIEEARVQVNAVVAAAIVWNHFFACDQLSGLRAANLQLRSTDCERSSRHLVGREKFLLGVLLTLGSSDTTDTFVRCLRSKSEGGSML